jgi:hypothetical protein
MARYDTVVDRTQFYAETSGLPKARVAAYRRRPVTEWTRRADRRIASTIRGLEALWADPDVTVGFWLRMARGTLRAVRAFVLEVIDTVQALGERIANAVDRAMSWFLRTTRRAEEWLDAHPRIKRILEGLLMILTASLSKWLGGRRLATRTA